MREEDRGGEAAWVRRGCRRMNLSMKVIGYIALLATQVTAWLMTNKPRYLVWISQWHTISLKLPLLLGNNKPQVCTFTALSSTNKAFGLILVLQKELFGKSRGMNHKVAQISFFWEVGGGNNGSKGSSSHTQCNYVAIFGKRLPSPEFDVWRNHFTRFYLQIKPNHAHIKKLTNADDTALEYVLPQQATTNTDKTATWLPHCRK